MGAREQDEWVKQKEHGEQDEYMEQEEQETRTEHCAGKVRAGELRRKGGVRGAG